MTEEKIKSNIIHIKNHEEFEEHVINSQLPTIVKFWAPWCGPCKSLSPVFTKISNTFTNQVIFTKFDIDSNEPHIPTKYQIRSVPTIIFFKDQKKQDTKTGFVSEEDLTEWIKSNLKK